MAAEAKINAFSVDAPSVVAEKIPSIGPNPKFKSLVRMYESAIASQRHGILFGATGVKPSIQSSHIRQI